jgi:anthranilate/para-aminobenzoate synthase component I
MTKPQTRTTQYTALTLAVAVVSLIFLGSVAAMAQNQAMEQKLMAIKDAQAANKQKLAQYTWTETETIAIKGSTKDTKTYQVQMVNGQQQKTLVNNQKAQSGGREGRAKERVVEKKTAEYQEYGQQIGALAKQYTTPNPDALMQAKQAGNISLQPGSGTVSLVIKNYIKQGDSMTMNVSEQTHSPVSVQVNSYLNDPKDAVTISAQFAQLPDGTNHVANMTINGVSKELTVNEQNSNYQHQ